MATQEINIRNQFVVLNLQVQTKHNFEQKRKKMKKSYNLCKTQEHELTTNYQKQQASINEVIQEIRHSGKQMRRIYKTKEKIKE